MPVTPYGNGGPTLIPRPASDKVYNLVLAADTNKVVTVPTGYNFAVLSYSDGQVWVRVNAAVTIPVADVTDGTGAELVPTHYDELTTGDTINLRHLTGAKVGIAFYKIKGAA